MRSGHWDHRRPDHHRRDRAGPDQVPTPAHLASWARFAPGVAESAGRKKGNSGTGHGNRYLARALGEAAVGVGRTNTFLGERYRRIARRRSKKRAIVAVGRSILMIIWQLLSDDEKRFVDLGPGYYESHINRSTRSHVRELQALGYNVILEPAARNTCTSSTARPPARLTDQGAVVT